MSDATKQAQEILYFARNLIRDVPTNLSAEVAQAYLDEHARADGLQAALDNSLAVCEGHIAELEQERAANQRTHGELVKAQSNNRDRNLELDALHYVWCDGGCEGGVHRFGEHPPVTAELVATAIRNTERLRAWYINNQGHQEVGTVEARSPIWRRAEKHISESLMRETQSELAQERALHSKMETLLEAHRRWHGKDSCPGFPDCYVCHEEAIFWDVEIAEQSLAALCDEAKGQKTCT